MLVVPSAASSVAFAKPALQDTKNRANTVSTRASALRAVRSASAASAKHATHQCITCPGVYVSQRKPQAQNVLVAKSAFLVAAWAATVAYLRQLQLLYALEHKWKSRWRLDALPAIRMAIATSARVAIRCAEAVFKRLNTVNAPKRPTTPTLPGSSAGLVLAQALTGTTTPAGTTQATPTVLAIMSLHMEHITSARFKKLVGTFGRSPNLQPGSRGIRRGKRRAGPKATAGRRSKRQIFISPPGFQRHRGSGRRTRLEILHPHRSGCLKKKSLQISPRITVTAVCVKTSAESTEVARNLETGATSCI